MPNANMVFSSEHSGRGISKGHLLEGYSNAVLDRLTEAEISSSLLKEAHTDYHLHRKIILRWWLTEVSRAIEDIRKHGASMPLFEKNNSLQQ